MANIAERIKVKAEWYDGIAEREGDSRVDPNWLAMEASGFLRGLEKDAKRDDEKMAEARQALYRLIGSIEGMELNCDGEVYEELLEIAGILGR